MTVLHFRINWWDWQMNRGNEIIGPHLKTSQPHFDALCYRKSVQSSSICSTPLFKAKLYISTVDRYRYVQEMITIIGRHNVQSLGICISFFAENSFPWWWRSVWSKIKFVSNIKDRVPQFFVPPTFLISFSFCLLPLSS